MTRAEIHDFIDREFDPLDHVPHRKDVYCNMATDPKKSEGARMERKSMRAKLRRLLNASTIEQASALMVALDFVQTRQARYDKKPGGL